MTNKPNSKMKRPVMGPTTPTLVGTCMPSQNIDERVIKNTEQVATRLMVSCNSRLKTATNICLWPETASCVG